jgi:hypothetical protein
LWIPASAAAELQLTERKVKQGLEQKQSKRALDESLKGGFSLRKKPLEGIASGYTYSGFAIQPNMISLLFRHD